MARVRWGGEIMEGERLGWGGEIRGGGDLRRGAR